MSIVEKAASRLQQPDQGKRSGQHKTNGAAWRGEPQPADSGISGNQARDAAAQGDRGEPPGKVVTINSAALRRAGLAPPEAYANHMAREYQRIKRPLLATIDGAMHGSGVTASNQLMITSAMAGEGKTFTSFNLALSLARERDHSVLLVDGDVIKPAVTRALGLTDHAGLMDLLNDDDLSPEATIVETDIPGLSVLPAGRRNNLTSELLSSRRMAWLAEELSADPSRIVIFDSSPLLATSESQALALNMGQIVVVVKAGKTERRAVEAALSLIAAPDRTISMVLNQSRKAHGDAYAGYYGMYYGEQESV